MRCTHGLSRAIRTALVFALTVLTQASVGSAADDTLRLAWRKNILTVSSPRLPGGKVEIWYLEAFCRSGSTNRDWRETVIPHRTEMIAADADGRRIRLKSTVEPGIEVLHDIRSTADEVDFRMTLTNRTDKHIDADWLQPCIRVGTFTGLGQEEYPRRCFIFTQSGLTMLDKTRRTVEARYRGGQVYVPAGVNRLDVNPRPLSPDVPVNGLIGCVSADGKLLLANAWDHTQELFQGVIVCIHNDPRIGGLGPRETKKLHGKLYILDNDPDALLARYRRDFGTPP